MSVAKRLVVVDFGRKVTEGDPAEVMASSEVKSIYMGEDALD
jgi:branched-chain amino acid transport system ATP-binding protein